MGTRVATGERRPATSNPGSDRQAAKSSPGEGGVSFAQAKSYSSQRSCRQRQRQLHKRREHSEKQARHKSSSSSRADERRAEPRSHRSERRRRAQDDHDEPKPKPTPSSSSSNNGAGASETIPSTENIPENQLKQLAKEILDQTKQLGFFDEVRMLLLEQIESSSEFQRVQEAFSREVGRFCSRADLSAARSKLRDQLQAETFANEDSALSRRLQESIDRITYEYTREKLRPLYNEHATRFLEERHHVIKQQQQRQEPSNVITTATTHIAGDKRTSSSSNTSRESNHRELTSRKLSSVARDSPVVSSMTLVPSGHQSQEPEQEQLSLSCCSSHADSGFSLSPARENHDSRSPQKLTETLDGNQPARQSPSPRGADKTTVISTAVAMAAIMMKGSGTPQRADAGKGQPKDRLADRYARRRERRIKTKANRQRLRAQLLDSRRAS